MHVVSKYSLVGFLCNCSLLITFIRKLLFKVTRVIGSVDSLSSLRVSQRLFAHHSGASEMSFYRLSMPIECAAVLISPAGGVLPVASNSLTPGRVEVVFYFHSHNRLIRLPYA